MAKGENGNGNGQAKGTTTAIGPTIVIKGKLRSDEDLVVKGRIEAEIQSSKALLVENSGIIKANVRVKSARISGVLVGNITAEERVEIAPDGRMVGDITAPKIIINDGAAFRGRIDMQNFDQAGETHHEPKSEPVAAPAPKAPHAGGDQTTAAAAK
jgi:cytoskeletal protein CcmA (bactofilin family)